MIDLGAYLERIGISGPARPRWRRCARSTGCTRRRSRSTSPASHFTRGPIAARTAPGRRYALRGNQLAVHHTGGPTQRTALGSAGELRATLEATFGIAAPADPALDAALERAARAAG